MPAKAALIAAMVVAGVIVCAVFIILWLGDAKRARETALDPERTDVDPPATDEGHAESENGS